VAPGKLETPSMPVSRSTFGEVAAAVVVHVSSQNFSPRTSLRAEWRDTNRARGFTSCQQLGPWPTTTATFHSWDI
jgi:hypothetical protein